MLIANPIYDVVFKRMMENERVAKFFIGTLLDENIVKIEVKPQEFTYIKDLDLDDPKVKQYLKEKIQERLLINVFRLDFVATIKTESGKFKKILIEIQKAQNLIDLMRFRNYLAEQYKKEDVVNNEKVVLPITTIYILGFELPEISSPCIKVARNYMDLIEKKVIDEKSDFIEKLTHDAFVVQVNKVTNRFQTKLDKLLSIFEQSNFIDEKKTVKEFSHQVDIEDLKIATDILHFSGINPEERKKIEVEQEAWRTINAMLEEIEKQHQQTLAVLIKAEQELKEKNQKLEEKSQELEEKSQELEEKSQELEEKSQELEEKSQELLEKDRIIEELMKKLKDKNS